MPEGTSIQVVTIDSIDSKKDTVGGTFTASLYSPLTVGEQVVAPKGSNVSIKLLGAATSGNFKGKSELHLALDSIEAQGKRYPVQSSTYSEVGKSQGKQTAKKVGVGAAVGATIGAIAGGGKGAAIGAGVGAGGGRCSAGAYQGRSGERSVRNKTRIQARDAFGNHDSAEVNPNKNRSKERIIRVGHRPV